MSPEPLPLCNNPECERDDHLIGALRRAGDELAARLREVRDEFHPAEDCGEDLGWFSVDAALSKWRRARGAGP